HGRGAPGGVWADQGASVSRRITPCQGVRRRRWLVWGAFGLNLMFQSSLASTSFPLTGRWRKIHPMSAERTPYLNAYGNSTKALERIRTAQAPPRFTQDFLGTTLDLRGGSATPLIPFLKRTGFLGSDGVPTELYKRFRNPSKSQAAAAEALKTG